MYSAPFDGNTMFGVWVKASCFSPFYICFSAVRLKEPLSGTFRNAFEVGLRSFFILHFSPFRFAVRNQQAC